MMKLVSVVFLWLLVGCFGKNNEDQIIDDIVNNSNSEGWKLGIWKKYLQSKGYIPPNTKLHPSVLKRAITKLRILYKFDNTVDIRRIGEFLEKPRCGVPDLKNHTKYSRKRVRRYNVYAGWPKQGFTWMIKKYRSEDKGLFEGDQKRIIKTAFEVWNAALPTQLTFAEVTSLDNADFKFSFVSGKHADCDFVFDGEGHDIAHAFFPRDGHIHFDDDEHFTNNPTTGIFLLSVAIHEIGHALGIDHSFQETCAMYPIYKQGNPVYTLCHDDIQAIQALYAVAQESSPCTNDDDSMCQFYAGQGFCVDYADVMYEVCRKECDKSCN